MAMMDERKTNTKLINLMNAFLKLDYLNFRYCSSLSLSFIKHTIQSPLTFHSSLIFLTEFTIFSIRIFFCSFIILTMDGWSLNSLSTCISTSITPMSLCFFKSSMKSRKTLGMNFLVMFKPTYI